MGIFKNQTDLRYLREAGAVAGEVCDLLIAMTQPGVSTVTLEQEANKLLGMRKSSAPFKPFEGFNHATCISINAEVINGPPSRERLIQPGDVVSIAIGSCVRGLHGKAARTVFVGDTPPEDVKRLLDGTQALFGKAVELSKTVKTLNEIMAHVPEIAGKYGLSVVEDSGGCGIGKQMHEPPTIWNDPGAIQGDIPLVPGLAFTLMPIMCLGESGKWVVHEDGWTQVTEDNSLSAHFAETFLMTDTGLEILTRNRS